MASVFLHGPRAVTLMDAGCKHNCSLASSSPTLKTKQTASAFGDRAFSMNIRQKSRKFPAPQSTSEEAVTVEDAVTVVEGGGVVDIEDEATFQQYLQNAGNKLVVLDISTKTCGPCKMIYPKLVKMSKEYPDAVFLKINGDHSNDTRALMRKWGVRAVPNFRFFRNGELIHSHNGANEDELRSHFLVHYIESVQA